MAFLIILPLVVLYFYPSVLTIWSAQKLSCIPLYNTALAKRMVTEADRIWVSQNNILVVNPSESELRNGGKLAWLSLAMFNKFSDGTKVSDSDAKLKYKARWLDSAFRSKLARMKQ